MRNVTYQKGGNTYGNTSNFRRYNAPNWTYYSEQIDPSIFVDAAQMDQKGGLRKWFDDIVNNYKSRYQARHAGTGTASTSSVGGSAPSNSTALVPAGNASGTSGVAGNPSILSALKSNVAWTPKSGLNVMGRSVGKYVPWLSGGVYGLQALQGLDSLNDSRESTDDLVNQILLSASGNPNTYFDLTSDQRKLLRSLKRDGNSSDADWNDIDWWNVLQSTGTGVLTGALGGVPGMVVGGLGGAINAGIDSMNSAQVSNQAELEALLEALSLSEMNYNNMVRQRAYANF